MIEPTEPKETKEIEYAGEMGFRLPHELAEQISKQKIISRALDWMPVGGRIIIAKDPVPTKIGRLWLTDQQRDQHSAGAGWVISVGPTAGKFDLQPIGNLRVERPEDLLGLHVMFGYHTGKVMRFSVFDSEYESEILVLSPVDIWAIDMNPAGAESVKEFEEAYAKTAAGEEDERIRQEIEAASKLEEDRAASVLAQEQAAREGDERAASIITGQERGDE